MKYIFGAIIISFAFILIAIFLLATLKIDLTEDIEKYIGIAWIILAIVCYPLAKKIVR